eukprot:2391494-Alexandrium_andersonii.AAC.1
MATPSQEQLAACTKAERPVKFLTPTVPQGFCSALVLLPPSCHPRTPRILILGKCCQLCLFGPSVLARRIPGGQHHREDGLEGGLGGLDPAGVGHGLQLRGRRPRHPPVDAAV